MMPERMDLPLLSQVASKSEQRHWYMYARYATSVLQVHTLCVSTRRVRTKL